MPDEDGKGWEKNDDGELEPIWSYGDILPHSLMDLIESSESEDESEDEEFEEDYDFDDILEYLDDEDDEYTL